jgi:hypothetical protein
MFNAPHTRRKEEKKNHSPQRQHQTKQRNSETLPLPNTRKHISHLRLVKLSSMPNHLKQKHRKNRIFSLTAKCKAIESIETLS